MIKGYELGGICNNSLDIDANGRYLYIAVIDADADVPQVLKMLASLTANADVSYDPGAGTEVNVMAGDLSAYWIWAAGEFGGVDKVAFTGDSGGSWYIQDDGTFGAGAARPLLVGPGNDSLVTTAVGTQLWQNRYDGDFQYWIERYIPGSIVAVDRVDEVFERTVIGGYWYTGDSSELVFFSPNSGLNWANVTDGVPNAIITSIIVGQ